MRDLREETVWSMSVTYGGEVYSFSWNKTYDADSEVLLGSWAQIVKSGEAGQIDEAVRRAVLESASVFRVMELKDEIRFEGFNPLSERETFKGLVVSFAERSWAGEYLGQRSGNNNFYVQDLAAILDIPIDLALELVDEVHAEGGVGLTGYILIPYEDEVASKQRLYERTGHRNLSVSDFGYWGCSSCGKSGDDMTDPADFECEKIVS